MHSNAWKIMSVTFFMIADSLAKSQLGRFCQSRTNHQKQWRTWFFMHLGAFMLTFLISKILIKIWPSLTKFWSNLDLKNVFLQTQNGFCQDGLIPRVWSFFLAPFKSYLAWCAQNSKADLSVTLRPLKLQIGEKMPRPMKFRPKASLFTYPHPFWKVMVPIQVLWSHSRLPPFGHFRFWCD